jgi:hypothetical protein
MHHKHLVATFHAVVIMFSMPSYGVQLQFNAEGTFKLVQFTDLHYGEHESLDQASTKVRT